MSRNLHWIVGGQWIVIAALAVLLLVAFVGGDARVPAAPPPAAGDAITTAPPLTAPPAAEAPADRQPPPRAEVESSPTSGDAGLDAVLFGRVVDAAGEPLDTHVWLQPPVGKERWSARSERGQYAIAGVPAGRYTLNARNEGFHDFRLDLEVPPGTPHLRQDVVLRRAAVLKVTFLDEDGSRLQPKLAALDHYAVLSATASRQQDPGPLPLTEHRQLDWGIGRWRRTRGGFRPDRNDTEHDGELQLDGEPPVFVHALLRSAVVATVLVPAGQDDVTMTIAEATVRARAGSFRVRVLDAASGEPITGTRVDLSDRQSAGPRPVGADGVFAREVVPPGVWELSVWAPDREPYYRWLSIGAGQAVDLGDIRLGAGATIEGRCVDGAGAAVQPRVTWYEPDVRHPMQTFWQRTYQVEADGSFRLSNLPRARVVVLGNLEDRLATALVDLSSGQTAKVTLSFTAAAVLALEVPPLADGAHANVQVTSAEGVAVYTARSRGHPLRADLKLPPGRYRVELVGDDGRSIASRTVRLASEAVAVTLP